MLAHSTLEVSFKLVRPFSDIHAEFWPQHKINRILGMVVPPLPTDRETVALIAGDLGLAHSQETWLKPLGVFSRQFRAVVYDVEIAAQHSLISCIQPLFHFAGKCLLKSAHLRNYLG